MSPDQLKHRNLFQKIYQLDNENKEDYRLTVSFTAVLILILFCYKDVCSRNIKIIRLGYNNCEVTNHSTKMSMMKIYMISSDSNR